MSDAPLMTDMCARFVAVAEAPEHQVDGRISATTVVMMLRDLDQTARLEGWAEVLERIAAGDSPASLAREMRQRLTDLQKAVRRV